KWKQLLYGKRTIAGIREALRPVLRESDIQLPRLRSYLTGAIRLAYLCFLLSLLSYSLWFICLLLPLYGFYRLFLHNLEGDGVIARGNKLLMDYLLSVDY